MDHKEEDRLYGEFRISLIELIRDYLKKGLESEAIIWSTVRFSTREIALEFIQEDKTKIVFMDYIHQVADLAWMEAKGHIKEL